MVHHGRGCRPEHACGPGRSRDYVPSGRNRLPPHARLHVRFPPASLLERSRAEATHVEAWGALEPLPSGGDASATDELLVSPATERCSPRIRRGQVLLGGVARPKSITVCDEASMLPADT